MQVAYTCVALDEIIQAEVNVRALRAAVYLGVDRASSEKINAVMVGKRRLGQSVRWLCLCRVVVIRLVMVGVVVVVVVEVAVVEEVP